MGDWDGFWRRKGRARAREIDVPREYRSFYWRLLSNRLQRLYGRIEGLRSLELGSGAGVLSLLLGIRGARPTLLDSSAAALEAARELFGRHGVQATFIEGDLLARPPACRPPYDLTISLGTGEHFVGEERARFWRMHWELLRPGGLLFAAVPNAACPPYRLYEFLSRRLGFWGLEEEVPYHRTELEILLNGVGAERAEVVGSPLVNDTLYFLLGGAVKLVGGTLVALLPRAPNERREESRESLYRAVDRSLKRIPPLPGPLDDRWGYSLAVAAERPAPLAGGEAPC